MTVKKGIQTTVWQGLVAMILSLVVTSNAMAALSRPTVAVVLGGGAARGLSHIGLLQALEEEGIPVDMLVGTSMGSIVAGLYASGLSTENLTYLVTRLDLTELFRPQLPPAGGFISTQRFEKFLDVLTEGAFIEDLPLPFYSVITNLVTGEEVALNEGALSRGIVASMAIPGMFPPVQIGDDYYVDGGMLSPVPVKVARDLGADFVIAVDVRRELEEIDHANMLTNVQLTLFFLLDANTISQLELADVVVAPDVETDSYMDYDRGEYFIAEGYAAAKRAMPQIKALLQTRQVDFSFSSEPVVRGFSTDEFARRVQEAVNSVTDQEDVGTAGARLSLTVGSGNRVETHFAYDFSLGRLGSVAPLFGTYSAQSRTDGWSHTVGLGTGICRDMCASIFGRRTPGGGRWHGGFALRGKLGDSLQYAGEWEGIGKQPTWHASVNAPASYDRAKYPSEVLLTFSRDGNSYHQGDVLYRRYLPGKRKDLWEAVSASSTAYVGAGARGAFRNGDIGLSPLAEAGVEFEARIFGLYPVRSRVALMYSGGDRPWSLRLTIGDL